jgi:osmotically-inducible protein OsmY
MELLEEFFQDYGSGPRNCGAAQQGAQSRFSNTQVQRERVMSRHLLGAVCVLFLCGALTAVGQQKDSDSIGDKFDRGVRSVESKLRETWGDVKRATHRMSVQGRVYARLYWDKSLADAPFQIEAKDGGVVVLKGSVPTAEAKRRAVDLAQSTVGVNEAVDELGVAPNKVK